MNEYALFQDLYARFITDTGANGLFPTGGTNLVNGIYYEEAPGAVFAPFIVISVVSNVQHDCFDVDGVDFVFTVNVFATKTPGDGAVAQRILERIYGDAIFKGDRTPSYGLHRHQLVYTTQGAISGDDWLYTHCVRRNARTQHQEGVYHFIQEYTVSAYRDINTVE